MDATQVKNTVETHAQAVVDPLDMERVQGDMITELHPALPQIAALLPTPVQSASVDSVDHQDDHAIALITYTGESGSITVRSRWEDRGAGQAQIVEVAPV